MKLAVLAFSVIAFGVVVAQDAKPDPCAAWVLDGYRANMSRDAALAVRPATENMRLVFDVNGSSGSHGTLQFDNAGKLAGYSQILDGRTSAADIVALLRAKLGEPDATDAVVKTFSGTGTMTAWSSTNCEAALSVVVAHETYETSERDFVTVSLARHSEIERLEQEKELRAKWANSK